MDGIKQRPARQGSAAHQRTHTSVPPKNPAKKQRHAGQHYWLVRSIGKVAAKGKQTFWKKYKQSEFARWHKKQLWRRGYTLAVLLLFVVSTVGTILQPFLDTQPYISEQARAILPKKNVAFGKLFAEDYKTEQFTYNKTSAKTSDSSLTESNQPRFSASFSKQAEKGITVTDTVNQIDFTLKPKFPLMSAKKEDNYMMYKLAKQDGVLVYTSRTASVKEDIILESYSKDSLTFEFELVLGSSLEARVEKDGSLGVYGTDLPINGNVGTGSEADAALLEKVRTNAKKTKLLFQIPAPVVLEASKKPSKATSRYELEGNTLKVITTHLKEASYPLSIDPTVYIETAAKLMRGNNETNTDFDVNNELIQKSQTTGARIDSWSSTSNLSVPTWGQGTAVAGGYIYSVGGGGGSSTTTSTYYTAGSSTYTVPAGVTSLTVKAWGAGGAGGAGTGTASAFGGNGGGGGYAKAVISVTPGENLDVLVGSGGAKGGANGRAGNGGGASSVQRSGTYLVEAGGGGGGGGRRGGTGGTTGHGGAGGGTTGVQGTAGSTGGPGLGGTPSAGGTGGTGSGGASGITGVAQAGGNAPPTVTSCATATSGTGSNGGTGGGGRGGTYTTTCAPGGGGGGGWYGGGGGGATNTNARTGGGGGGGSSYINPSGLVGGTDVNTAGSGQTPGNGGDVDRNGAGDGGTGGINNSGTSNGDDGGVVITYAITGPVATATVSWAQFNSNDSSITSPNPGTGACGGWCSQSVYDLPAERRGLSLIAYNGFLYAIGGSNLAGTPQTTVYVAKLGANGEPQLWHPTDTNKNNWVYWYSDVSMNLSSARSYFGAVAYNNKLYILGGLTTPCSPNCTVLSSNTVQAASINPNGTLTSWSATGMQALGTSRYGLTAQVYNDTLYVIGGNNTFNGSPVSTVEYSRLDSSGNMNSWKSASSLTSGRQTMGGNFSTIFAGYLYVAGGCLVVNSSGYCTSIASDVQLASINADGSLAPFNTILNLTNNRIGHVLVAWQGGLYRLGGCRAQDASSGLCTDPVLDVDYGVINETGEASTVNSSVPSGTPPCSGGNPYSCDLPGVSYIGNMLSSSAIVNGYLYIMGGCTNTNASPSNGCTTATGNIAYQAIGSDGSLTRPPACPNGSYVDSYCVDNVNTLPGNLLAGSATVFNSRIYVVGGNSAGASDNELNYVKINSDGSLDGAWTTQTMAGTGTALAATAVSFSYAYARANPSQADTIPGNLFIFGGCTGTAAGCSGYVDDVFKCQILPDGAIGNGSNGGADCTTTGQLQIGTIPGAGGTGLAAHAGTVYANYIYLVGGLANGLTDLTTLRYAKFDNSNNVVAVSGSAWVESLVQLNTGRRRGAGFGYNGYIYVVGGYDATNGVLADIEFAKIDVSDGSIIGSATNKFTVSSVTINQRWGLTVAVSNSYAYVIGGCTVGASPGGCTARSTTIQTFQIYNNDSGTPVNYGTDDLFGTDRLGASSAIYNGYIYVAGGCISSTDCTDATNDVQYAPIDAYGDIGTWNSTTALTQDRVWGELELAGGTLYYIGGQNDGGTAQTTVYYAVPQSNGTITSWSSASQALPQARSQFSAAVWNNRIYVTGGVNSGTVQSTVYISPTLSSSLSGGDITSAWNSTSGSATAFNVARSGHTTIAYANNLYVLGGYNGTTYLSDTQFASLGYKTGTIEQSGQTVTGSGTVFTSGQVGSVLQYPDGSTATILTRSSNTVITVSASKTVSPGTSYVIMDGSVGDWAYSTSLPAPLRQAGGFAANGYIYLVGGRTTDLECSPRTLVAPISANTTIATGNNPTGVGQWFETNVRYSGDRYGAAVSYNQGKIYVLGGGCTLFPTVASADTSNSNTENTTNNVTMPATVEANDLLLVMLTTDGGTGSTVTTPGGWTQVGGTSYTNGTNVRASLYAKIAVGNEDGLNVNFVTNNNEKSAAVVYRILAGSWYGTISTGVEWTGSSAGNTTTPDPPSLNPSNWATENTLWIGYIGGSTYTGVTTTPNGFYNQSHVNTGTTDASGASATTARKNSVIGSVDPSTFTMTGTTTQGVQATIAVRPAAGIQLTGANRVVETAVYSQAQIAKYSRMIDTDTDVFPTGWLMNGLDNSVGARWQVRYSSMHDLDGIVNPNEDCGTSATMATMTTWGQETNFGDTSLGVVNTYTPKNSSGSNINCARYYYFSLSIDASQTFGYPEDVNRGPTMSDISLFFTADPSKRLRHGATFTGGEQQPLDTPCRKGTAVAGDPNYNCVLP